MLLWGEGRFAKRKLLRACRRGIELSHRLGMFPFVQADWRSIALPALPRLLALLLALLPLSGFSCPAALASQKLYIAHCVER